MTTAQLFNFINHQRWNVTSMLGVDTASTNATEMLDVARDGLWELFEDEATVEMATVPTPFNNWVAKGLLTQSAAHNLSVSSP